MDLINRIASEYEKYSKYVNVATVVAATIVSAVVIVGLLKKKG